jgi:xanthine dehydrogenase accessory factor
MFKDLLQETLRCLNKGEPAVWAMVVMNSGSTPRGAGSKMLIKRGGVILGSVGGGPLEARTLNEAEKLLQKGGSCEVEFSLTGRDAAAADMICGGNARVYLEAIPPDARDFLETTLDYLERRESCSLITRLGPSEEGFDRRHLLACSGKVVCGNGALYQEDESQLGPTGASPARLVDAPDGEGQVFIDPLFATSRLFIFGGGHVSLELAYMAVRVGFEVAIVEDREDFATRERFPMADRLIVSPYDQAFDRIDLQPWDSLVIVTRGHLHDMTVLREALKYQTGYVGMIGSKRKKKAIYDHLIKEGVSQKELDRVHSPIGLKIMAETPAEIAVAIVAELIQVRAGLQSGQVHLA